MKTRRKLVPAIAMLLISALTLGSSSYAWFTMSRQVTATGIELTAVAPNNLLIASAAATSDGTDASKYSSSVTLAAPTGAKLIHASSWDGLTFYTPTQIKFGSGGAGDATTNFVTTTTALSLNTNGYYADFKLWLKTTGDTSVNVTAQDLGLYTSSSALALDKAVRYAVLDAAGTGINTSGSSYMYAPYYNTANSDPITYLSGLLGPIKGDEGTGLVYKGTAKTLNNYSSLNPLVTVPANSSPIEITIRVWVEGQDSHCVDANLTNSLALSIGFKDVTYTPAP